MTSGSRQAQPSAAAHPAITDREFAQFQALIQREAGIWLAPIKRVLLMGRLGRRLRELGVRSFDEYYQLVVSDETERILMLDRVTTNETHFFREPHHFELLRNEVFPALQAEASAGRRPRRVRIWSAACSTGEEPYSIAMTLLGAFPPAAGWELEVLATDLSTSVLDRARQAMWPIAKAEEIPAEELKSFMLRGVGAKEGWMKAGPEIRALVRFARLNLNDETFPDVGEFDVIFCRNVLIYFDGPTKERVVSRLVQHLSSTGYLFLGHAESLSGSSLPVRSIVPTVYAHGGAQREERRA